MKKPNEEERIKKAKDINPYVGDIKGRTMTLVQDCLKEKNIKAEVRRLKYNEVPLYEDMPKDEDRKMTSLIFIEFANNKNNKNNKFVAVVGAGKDIGCYETSKTGKILKESDNEWDEEELIIVMVEGLKAVAASKVENVFECRNGIEHYIGEYLLENNIPIINMDSHKNFTDEGWRKLQ